MPRSVGKVRESVLLLIFILLLISFLILIFILILLRRGAATDKRGACQCHPANRAALRN